MKGKQIKAFEEMYYVAQSKENPEEYISLLGVTSPIQSGYIRKFRDLEEAKKFIKFSGLEEKYRPVTVYKRYEVVLEEE